MAKVSVFTKAKRIRSQHPGKSWAQVVQIAAKGGTASKPKKRKTAKRKVTVKRTGPAKRRTATKRKSAASKAVGMSTVKSVVQEKLKNELWNKEKANTVKATKKAQKKITNYRSLLKRL